MTMHFRQRWPLWVGVALVAACVVTLLPARQVGADSNSFFVDPSSGGASCPIAHCNQHLNGREQLNMPLVRPSLASGVARALLAARAADAPRPVAPAALSATSGVSWTQQAELTSTAQTAYDGYGTAVAASGDTVVVGANGTPEFESYGAAYIFVRSGGAWTQQAELTDPGGVQYDQFGSAVAIDGDTAVIAAPRETGAVADSGAAFVYVRSGGVWTEQAKLIAPDGAAGDAFGFTVAISGTTIVVGAEGHNGGQGAAYIYVRSGSIWSEQAELSYPGPPVSVAEFGWAVAVSGDTALVSALGTALAFVYGRQGGTWTLQAVLRAPRPAGVFFGKALALSGDTALVGACCDPRSRLPGAAYVFVRSGGVWRAQAELHPASEQRGSQFGLTLGLSGQTAVIGGEGAYVFVDRQGTWYEQAQLIPTDVSANLIGSAVAVSGNTAVATRAAGVLSNLGAAYVFVRRPVSGSADPANASDAGPARRSG